MNTLNQKPLFHEMDKWHNFIVVVQALASHFVVSVVVFYHIWCVLMHFGEFLVVLWMLAKLF